MSKIKTLLRKILRLQRRVDWIIDTKQNKVEINAEDMEKAIRSVGVDEGDIIFVHSSLSALGYVLGGPNTIVDILMKVVTDKGTILMPVYPFQGSMLEYFSSKPVFNVALDKSFMGAVTENFRNITEHRSYHPSHSVAAWGKDAEWFIKEHHKDDSPFGENSPFYKAYAKKGKVLCIGSDIGQVTVYHIVEELVDFPKDVYLKEKYEAKVVTPNNTELSVVSKVHDPKAAENRIDNDKDTREYLEDIFSKNGFLKQNKLGKGKLSLLEINPMINFLIDGIESGNTIYGDLNNRMSQNWA